MLRLIAALLMISVAPAAPLNVLAIGDSLSEEYAFELPFSAPASDPADANTRNWPELFRIYRSTEATLGTYEGTANSYSDLRNGGHRFNFGIPGFTTQNWVNIINTENTLDEWALNQDDDPFRFYYEETHNALNLELDYSSIDVVVIFLGGNDLKQSYDKLYSNTEPAGFFGAILQNLQELHTHVRARLPSVPIVVATIPDVGATPNIYSVYNDPATAAATRSKIAGYNAQIISTFEALSNTTVARVDTVTDMVFDLDPFHLNGIEFTIEGDPENPPDRVFCRDDFHPATVGQAILTNEIISAINAQLPGSMTLFSNRDILTLTGLDPDQPYLDWVTPYSLTDSSMDGDDDKDGIPNIIEMLLNTPPDTFSTAFVGNWKDGVSWEPDPMASRYAELYAEESPDLSLWTEIPNDRLIDVDGVITATPLPGAAKSFVRLHSELRP